MKEREKRRALGRGLGALIPTAPAGERPVDVFFGPAPSAITVDLGTKHAAADGDPSDLTDSAETTDPTDAAAASSSSSPTDAPSAGTGPADPDNDALRPVPGATFAELPVESIRPNPRQPRTVFDEDDMAELVHSVSEIGILQPIVVRRVDDGGPLGSGHDAAIATYELVMGERRWRAAQAAGLEHVPAIIRSTHDDLLRRTCTGRTSTRSRRLRPIGNSWMTSAAPKRSWPPGSGVAARR